MIYKTHINFAIAVTIPTIQLIKNISDLNLFTNLTQLFLFLSITSLFAIFPDIDEPESKISRSILVKPFSLLLSIFVSHRGFTHNFCGIITFIILASILTFIANQYYESELIYYSFFAALNGYILHILGDSMTLSGIRNFFCKKKKQFTLFLLPKFLRFKTFSKKEDIFNYFFILMIFIEIYYFFFLQNSYSLRSFIEN